MKLRGAVLTACGILTGCASSMQTYAPDGRQAYSLNCSGWARGWDACLQKAGEICAAKGYDVIDRSGESGFMMGGGSSAGFAGSAGSAGSGFYGGTTQQRTMLISCKSPQ